MSKHRKPLPIALINELYHSQDNHCAMCLSKDQLDAHHIIPLKNGGSDMFDNLVLLCKSCHTTADSDVIHPAILKYYKYTCKTDPIVYPRDKIGIYHHFSTSIIKELTQTYNTDLIKSASNVIRHLKRSRDNHYRDICLNLINAILFSNMHSERLSPLESSKLVNLAQSLLKEAKENDSNLLIKKQIYHNIGILHHNHGNHNQAIDMYKSALSIRADNPDDNFAELIRAEDFITHVHMTSTLYLNGAANQSFHVIENVLSSSNLFDKGIFYDAHSFGIIRRAEHYIGQNKIDKAQEELNSLLSKKLNESINPIHQVIMYKDLARVYLMSGENEKGKYYIIAALTLAKKFGYFNQIAKIKGMQEVRLAHIDMNELERLLFG